MTVIFTPFFGYRRKNFNTNGMMFYLSFAKEVKDVSLDLTLQTGKVGHGQT